MSQNTGVWVIDTLKTPDTIDTFPVVDANDAKGGVHYAADTTARDAIPAARRYEGMLCYVVADTGTYQLQGGVDNANWTSFGGAGSINDVVEDTTPQLGGDLDVNTHTIISTSMVIFPFCLMELVMLY